MSEVLYVTGVVIEPAPPEGEQHLRIMRLPEDRARKKRELHLLTQLEFNKLFGEFGEKAHWATFRPGLREQYGIAEETVERYSQAHQERIRPLSEEYDAITGPEEDITISTAVSVHNQKGTYYVGDIIEDSACALSSTPFTSMKL